MGDGELCKAVGLRSSQIGGGGCGRAGGRAGEALARSTSVQDLSLRVKDLLDQQSGLWNMQLPVQLLGLNCTLNIISNQELKPVQGAGRERSVWQPSRTGVFSVRSAYRVLRENVASHLSLPNFKWALIWQNQLLVPRVRLFQWKVCTGTLPVAATLATRLSAINPQCKGCQMANETIHHILFGCDVAQAIWFASAAGTRSLHLTGTVPEIPQQLHTVLGSECFALCANIMWALWKTRCELSFQGVTKGPTDILLQYASNIHIREVQHRSSQTADRLQSLTNHGPLQLGFLHS